MPTRAAGRPRRTARRRPWLSPSGTACSECRSGRRRRRTPGNVAGGLTPGHGRAVWRTEDGRPVTPRRGCRAVARSPRVGAARAGDLSRRCRRAIHAGEGPVARGGLAWAVGDRRRHWRRVRVDLAPGNAARAPLRDSRLLARHGRRVGPRTATVWRGRPVRGPLDPARGPGRQGRRRPTGDRAAAHTPPDLAREPRGAGYPLSVLQGQCGAHTVPRVPAAE